MKSLKLFVILWCLLVGCQSVPLFENTITYEQSQNYRSYYNLTLSAVAYQTDSDYFKIQTEINPLGDSFRYDIFIDEPKIEMKNLLVMVVEDNTVFEIQKDMMPNVGIFDESIHLVPYQSNPDLGYYKGINLNRVVANSVVNLKIYVQFESGEDNQIIKQFFNFDLKP